MLLLPAVLTTAAKTPNLTGTWTGSESWLYWDGNAYSYNGPDDLSLVVTNQSGLMFYGTIFDGQPVVGNISTSKQITAPLRLGRGDDSQCQTVG